MSDDARGRFVEAMKLAWLYAGDVRMGRVIDDAADAFADTECSHQPQCCGGDLCDSEDAPEFGIRILPNAFEKHLHAACRAALRKEVFGE